MINTRAPDGANKEQRTTTRKTEIKDNPSQDDNLLLGKPALNPFSNSYLRRQAGSARPAPQVPNPSQKCPSISILSSSPLQTHKPPQRSLMMPKKYSSIGKCWHALER